MSFINCPNNINIIVKIISYRKSTNQNIFNRIFVFMNFLFSIVVFLCLLIYNILDIRKCLVIKSIKSLIGINGHQIIKVDLIDKSGDEKSYKRIQQYKTLNPGVKVGCKRVSSGFPRLT